MFQALFNSLSGLFSFSKSLNTVSNNVANMNTPGFRGSDSFFANVNGGLGTRIAGEGLRTTPGDIRQTGNPSDVAVDGEGYFVLRDEDGMLHYTRAGQFRFDENGFLADSVSGFQVMAMDDAGALTAIDLDDYRTIPAVATTRVRATGNLAPTAATATLNNVTVFDSAGVAHTLTAALTANGAAIPGSFLVAFTDESGATVGNGEIRFATDGTLQVGFNQISVTLPYAGGSQAVVLDFGTPGALNGVTSLAGMATSLAATTEDGHASLGVNDLSFDENGVLRLVYSATEKRSGPQLALASLANESALQLAGGRLISDASVGEREIGRPGAGKFGNISGSSLEMSNVNLTQEFADMIIIQRGYQASSRVMTVSNEMLEQLYNSTRGG